MNTSERILERNGDIIHFWMSGQPDKPLVVFTHGALVDHHEWDADLPILAGHYSVMAWDVRGHGLSRPAVFSLAEAEQDLLSILDKLQVRQAILVGHSMGGNLHQELVFHHPERVKAMVFLDCTWNFQKLTSFEKFMLKLAGPIFRVYPYKLLVDQSLASVASTQASRELLRQSMAGLSKAEFMQIMMATSDCLHYEPNYRINKPLLMMVGDKDMNGNIRRIMPVWAKKEPDCRFEVIPNARHAANLDNPGFFQKTLLDFLMQRSL
jgi:3-oxoadipate enol-lactonase